MKRRRHNKVRPLRVETQTADIHLRLCHRCFHLNESSSLVTKCLKCERPFSDDFTRKPNEVPIDRDSPEALDESDPLLEAMSDFDNASEEDHTSLNSVQAQQEDDDDDDEQATTNQGVNGLAVRW